MPSFVLLNQNTTIGKLCKAYVRSKYIRVVAVLVEICKVNKIISWWEWWEAQKFHIVPAFRGFCVSDLNLAQVGHAMLNTSFKMQLSMATHRDICHFMVQDREYTGFQTKSTCLQGRGPTLLQTKRKRKRVEEIFIQQCKENIEQGNIEQEIPNDPEEILVPNKRARHRVPKTFSSANLTQKKKKNKINQMCRKQKIITQVNRIKRRI